MKKGIKLVLGFISLGAILVFVYVILIMKGILPNPFLDTKDLICNREYVYGDYFTIESVIFSFDSEAVVKTAQKVDKIENKTNRETINSNYSMLTEVENLTKEEIKKKYKEYYYECN